MKVYAIINECYNTIYGITTNEEDAKRMMSVNKHLYNLKLKTYETDDFPKFTNDDPLWLCTGYYGEKPEVDTYSEELIIDESKIKKLGEFKLNDKYDPIYTEYEVVIQAKDAKTASKMFTENLSMFLITKDFDLKELDRRMEEEDEDDFD